MVNRAASHFSGVVFLSRRDDECDGDADILESPSLRRWFLHSRERGHKNYLAEGVKKELSWQFVNGQQWICSTFTGGSWIAQKFSLLKGTLLRSGRYVWYL